MTPDPGADRAGSASLDHAQRTLGIEFGDPSLLRRALTHPSIPDDDLGDYERLEFLGDSVLGLVVTDHLFRTFPEYAEGELAKLRAAVVSGDVLAEVASGLGLGDLIHMDPGAERTGGRGSTSILAACLEAVIGALYIDQGMDVAARFVLGLLVPDIIPAAAAGGHRDHKTLLQEATMAVVGTTPEYRIVDSSGPDHSRSFTAEVIVADKVLGTGHGPSKKAAEKEAARIALEVVERGRRDAGESR